MAKKNLNQKRYLPENDKYEPQKTIKAVPIFWLPLHHQQQL